MRSYQFYSNNLYPVGLKNINTVEKIQLFENLKQHIKPSFYEDGRAFLQFFEIVFFLC